VHKHQQKRKINIRIKDSFYEELENIVTGCPKNNIKILLGDFNAKVGFKDQGRSVVGNCGLHEESNDNGLRLIRLASALNMVIGSTIFHHKKIHLATWRSSDGITNSQINHILIDARHKNNMMHVRTYMGANDDSDYYLVTTRIRAHISTSKYDPHKHKTIRYNICYLKQTETRKEHEQKLKDLYQEVGKGLPIEEEWTNLGTILKIAE
jgi:hypothetical protein